MLYTKFKPVSDHSLLHMHAAFVWNKKNVFIPINK